MTRFHLLTLTLLLSAAGCADCGGDNKPPPEHRSAAVDIETTVVYADAEGQQQVVVLGDTLATGYGVPLSEHFLTLLMNNDDLRYPDSEGQDIATLRPGSEDFNLAIEGVRATDVLQLQVPNVPENSSAVILILGTEDFLDCFGQDAETGAASAAIFADTLGQILTHLRNPSRFAALPYVYIVNVLDVTDGDGDWDSLFGGGHWADGEQVLQAFNAAIADQAQAYQATLVNAHSSFLGHGVHHDDSSNPYFDSQDASQWVQDDGLRLNARGHSELRHLLFHTLFLR